MAAHRAHMGCMHNWHMNVRTRLRNRGMCSSSSSSSGSIDGKIDTQHKLVVYRPV